MAPPAWVGKSRNEVFTSRLQYQKSRGNTLGELLLICAKPLSPGNILIQRRDNHAQFQ